MELIIGLGGIEIEASLIELMRRNRGRQLSHEPAGKFPVTNKSIATKGLYLTTFRNP